MPVIGLLIVVAIIAFLFVGGGSEKSTIERGQEVKEQVNTDVLILPWQHAIKGYEAINSSLPKSLDDLDSKPTIPDGYDVVYDPATGEVEFVKE